jgi:hypothetical protein
MNSNLASTFTDFNSGEILPVHPDEQVRVPIINPHGFQDMKPVYDQLMQLLSHSNDREFQARFINKNYYYQVTTTKVKDAAIPHYNIILSYGVIEKNAGEDIETQYGLLESLLFLKSKQITVANSISYEDKPSSPTKVLRSFVQNGFLNIPMSSFELLI